MSEDKKAEVKSEEKKNVEIKNQKESKKVKKQGDVAKRFAIWQSCLFKEREFSQDAHVVCGLLLESSNFE